MDKYFEEHFKVFGVAPVIIGLNWDDEGATIDGIVDAIDNGQPYSEIDQLTEEEKILYSEGKLKF